MSKAKPTAVDETVLESITISESDEWWAGVLRTRSPTGETRVLLKRRTFDEVEGWKDIHTWRVRPDFWDEERKAVARFRRGAGTTSPPSTPIHPRYDVKRYLQVRKDDQRWVAVVQLERPYKPPVTRLYHWHLPDEATRQKWTISNWTKERDIATRQLSLVA